MLFDAVEIAIIVNNNGDEQGLEAKAKNIPIIKVIINKLFVLF